MPQGLGYGSAVGLEKVLSQQFQRALEAQRIKEQQRAFQLQQQRLDQDRSASEALQNYRSADLGLRTSDVQNRRNIATEEATRADEAAQEQRIQGGLRMNNLGGMIRTLVDPSKRPAALAALQEGGEVAPFLEPDEEDSPFMNVGGGNVFNTETQRFLSAPQQGGGGAVAAGGAGVGAPSEPSRLAQMAARSPEVMQRMTDTESGKLMREIANDPELASQFEATQAEPVRRKAEQVLGALDQLLQADESGEVGLTGGARAIFGSATFPATRGIQGSLAAALPGGTTPSEAADAAAAVRQVIGQGVVDLIADMKSQSATGATGFGQLNREELNIILSAATQLTQRISEENALEQLKIVREGMQRILSDTPGATTQTEAPPDDPLGILGGP